MKKEEALREALALANRAGIVMLGTNGDNGYPNVKAMIKMENEGLNRIWLSTNTSSKRVSQLRRGSKCCIYFVDFEQWMGLMLVGEVEVLQDIESKQRLWREGFEKYYPLGVTDPDYSVLRFTAQWGNYYHALSNVTFDMYEATLEAITRIPEDLMNISVSGSIVNRLRRQYQSYLNAFPFMFSEEKNHVWQVLDAVESVLNNDHGSFSQDKEGDRLDKHIFHKFVSLADKLKGEGLVRQMWIIVLLHDIAKYGVRNAGHAQISGKLVRDLFEVKDFGLTGQERERIAWVIGNHDVVGNIVSTAERAPRCLIEGLAALPNDEKQTRLDMLILLSLCDLRGTKNGSFVNDYNAASRFWAADFSWLEQKEKDLFGWRKDRLVRAFAQKDTEEKRADWEEAFGELPEGTTPIVERQFGRNIKIFTNLLYLALWLTGEELVKLFAVISLMAQTTTLTKPNPDFEVDFTKGAERDKPGPVVDGFRGVLKSIELGDLVLAKVTEEFNGQTIYGIPISVTPNNLVIDSESLSQRQALGSAKR